MWVCPFLASPRKGPKEGDLRGHSEKACPLKKPLRRLASRCPKMFRFLNTYNTKIERFLPVDSRKSEHFRESDGDAAGGVHRGGRLFEAPPLCRFLWLLSWRSKKVTLPYGWLSITYTFFTKKQRTHVAVHPPLIALDITRHSPWGSGTASARNPGTYPPGSSRPSSPASLQIWRGLHSR